MINGIKSILILKKIFSHIEEGIKLKLLKHNKKYQDKLNLSTNDYKNYSNLIIIDIIPKDHFYGEENVFIKINKDISFYHFYINGGTEDLGRNYYNQEDLLKYKNSIKKIKVTIDGDKIQSLGKLFDGCRYVKEINFKKFNSINIKNMSYMFCDCSYLIKLNITKLKTDNVISMKYMFCECQYLKTLDVSNFENENVCDMSYMFYGCENLEEIKMFNIKNNNNELYLRGMFCECYNLKKLNFSNFQNVKVISMAEFLYKCKSLEELNMSNFTTVKSEDIKLNLKYMFNDCFKLKK